MIVRRHGLLEMINSRRLHLMAESTGLDLDMELLSTCILCRRALAVGPPERCTGGVPTQAVCVLVKEKASGDVKFQTRPDDGANTPHI